MWFFSFLVKFAQIRHDGGGLLLLLDEPGLTLHGKAQADLLRYFNEKIVPQHQVIFTTHSPFMVPVDNLPAVRIVEDRIFSPRPGQWASEGTKIRDDVMSVDRDTLFPLQGTLGYEVTQTLFVGKHTLLVEGPGDVVFLQAFSSALEKLGRRGLDRRWTVCPAGGLDKIQPFVALFSGAKLDIAALTDYAKADKRKMDSLKHNQALEGGRLLTFATILGREEADIEDIFELSLYVEIVNNALELSEDDRITVNKLDSIDTDTDRLVKKVEALARLLSPEAPEFDHYKPAEWLIGNIHVLSTGNIDVEATLGRAEKVINQVNSLLT